MLSLIEVTCPHCGAKGQIMLPPMGAIIVGPCPECKGLVVVFCGQVLPLDKEIMFKGSQEEQRDHLMSVVTDFLRDRVTALIAEEAEKEERREAPQASDHATEPKSDSTPEQTKAKHDAPKPKRREKAAVPAIPIGKEEVDRFVRVELNLIDNKDYFSAVFGN